MAGSPDKNFSLAIARAATQEIQLAALASLATFDRQGGTINAVQVDGSRWTWSAGGTANGGTVIAASGGGYWIRERNAGVWNAAWFTNRTATTHAGDWGACLTYIATLMSTGDTLIMPPGTYYTTSTLTVAPAITWRCEGALLDVDHNGVALDVNPGATGRTGDGYPEQRAHLGVLPGVQLRAVREGAAGSVGVRIVNAYWPRIQLQEITSFQTGLLLYAQGAQAAGRDLGVSYARIGLGRTLNFTNIKIDMAANTGVVNQPVNYVTEVVFLGGSLTGAAANLKHVHIPAGTFSVVDKIHFEGTTFEGAPGMVFDLDSCEFVTADRCRLEIGMGNITQVVRFRGGASCCDLELNGLNADDRFTLVTQDAGARWNVLRDNKFPFGPVRWLDGVLYMLGRKFDGWPAPFVEWQPERLENQRVFDLPVVDVNSPGAARSLNLLVERRWNITITGSGAVPANIAAWANEPAGEYEVEVTLTQSGTHASIDPNWLPGVVFGEFQQPVPNRIFKRDTYRIRKVNGVRYVVAHMAQP